MMLSDLLDRRCSVRAYTNTPVDTETLQRIQSFLPTMVPLYPNLRVRGEIVSREQVRCLMPWIPPHAVAIYSEVADGYLENVGFLYQQLDLYLQSIGLGSCWLGLGRMRDPARKETDDGLKYVIMLAFGHPKSPFLRTDAKDFNRKSLDAISDTLDTRLEPARLAPSSINSQPWYFVHEGDILHAYCSAQGILRARSLGDMNRIDMGIALAHLYVKNPDTFRFFKAENPPLQKGYGYIGSFTV